MDVKRERKHTVKWWAVAAAMLALALFPVLVLVADRMRPDRPPPQPKVRPVRTPALAPVTAARAVPKEPDPDLSKLERARLAWAELVGEDSGHGSGEH